MALKLVFVHSGEGEYNESYPDGERLSNASAVKLNALARKLQRQFKLEADRMYTAPDSLALESAIVLSRPFHLSHLEPEFYITKALSKKRSPPQQFTKQILRGLGNTCQTVVCVTDSTCIFNNVAQLERAREIKENPPIAAGQALILNFATDDIWLPRSKHFTMEIVNE